MMELDPRLTSCRNSVLPCQFLRSIAITCCALEYHLDRTTDVHFIRALKHDIMCALLKPAEQLWDVSSIETIESQVDVRDSETFQMTLEITSRHIHGFAVDLIADMSGNRDSPKAHQ